MKHIKRRLVFYIFNIWIIATVAFFCVYSLPGDTARIVLGRQASEQTLQVYREEAGLHLPVYQQYALFLNRTVHFNFGQSLVHRRPVLDLIRERTLATLYLMLLASFFTAFFGILALLCLKWLNKKWLSETIEKALLFLGIAPPYVLGVVMLTLAGGQLGWISVIFKPQNPGAWVLPALVLAAYPISVIHRLFGNQADLAMNSDYVLRSRSMGFSRCRILWREVLPNALTTAMPAFANCLAAFITGSFFVETIFGIPGLGRLTFEAISNKDITLLIAVCLLFAISMAIVSALLEMARYLIDPRLRSDYA